LKQQNDRLLGQKLRDVPMAEPSAWVCIGVIGPTGHVGREGFLCRAEPYALSRAGRIDDRSGAGSTDGHTSGAANGAGTGDPRRAAERRTPRRGPDAPRQCTGSQASSSASSERCLRTPPGQADTWVTPCPCGECGGYLAVRLTVQWGGGRNVARPPPRGESSATSRAACNGGGAT